MRASFILDSGASMLLFSPAALASDHLFTGIGAGGVTMHSQPFQNGLNNPGRPADTVPGQGSPHSGADHTTPAVESSSLLTHHRTELNTNANPGNGVLKTPPSVEAGKVAPSANSQHTAVFTTGP